MGLTISHNAYCGSYGSFHRFRLAVLEAAGGGIPHQETRPGLHEFLVHPDDHGEISSQLCRSIAEEMADLLPRLDARDEWAAAHARAFIDGANAAFSKGEPLEFY